MKRIISVIMCFALLLSATSVVSAASEASVCEYVVNNVEYTVEFENNALSADKKQVIAEILVGLRDGSAQTYGLGCTLFGHDLITDTVYVTEHKVRTSIPRCLRHTYHVTHCEDCDYTKSTTLISSTSVNCCPVD